MAKQPKTTEHYEVTCKAEIDQLGRIIAALTREGITEISHELVTNVRAFAQRTAKETTASGAIMAYASTRGSFFINEAIKQLEPQGYSSASIYGAASALVRCSRLNKIGPGIYEKAKLALPAPEKSSQTARTNKETILQYVKGRKEFKTMELAALFKKEGRNPTSISPQLLALKKENKIKAKANGEYIVLRETAAHG